MIIVPSSHVLMEMSLREEGSSDSTEDRVE